jgi:hypothetical protein
MYRQENDIAKMLRKQGLPASEVDDIVGTMITEQSDLDYENGQDFDLLESSDIEPTDYMDLYPLSVFGPPVKSTPAIHRNLALQKAVQIVKDFIQMDSQSVLAEFLLYGSTASGELYVHDLDLIALTSNQRLASYFVPSFGRLVRGDWYSSIGNNASLLANELDGYCLPLKYGIGVDMHVWPTNILTDTTKFRQYASLHRDPNFMVNASSSLMRYDRRSRRFVRSTFAELAKKYS